MTVRSGRVSLPRHAFGPSEHARPVDLWRILQDVAIQASADAGWPPRRYAATATGFVVTEATVVHHRPLSWGEPVTSRTWVADFRRGMLTRREIRLEVDGAAVVSSSHHWVHVGLRDGPHPTRASPELVAAFEPEDREPPPSLPAFEAEDGPGGHWRTRCPFDAVDPLRHANHPWYVGWCDEALAAARAEAGLDPYAGVAIAERIRFRGGVRGGDPLDVRWSRIGRVAGGDVWSFALEAAGVRAAEAVLVRA